jgi:hypothetical protein
MQGTKVSVKKTIIFSAYYLGTASFLVYNSFLIGGVPFVYVVPYSAVVIAAGYFSYRYSKRILSFWKLPNGDDGSSTIYSKGGLAIYLLYVAALIVRSAINFIFIGSEKFYFNNQQEPILENGSSAILIMPPLVHTDPATTILAFTTTDFLLMVGAIALIFLSPILAVAVWFVLAQLGIQGQQQNASGQTGIFVLSAVSFTIGLVTDEAISYLINFIRDRLGMQKIDSTNDQKNKDKKIDNKD